MACWKQHLRVSARDIVQDASAHCLAGLCFWQNRDTWVCLLACRNGISLSEQIVQDLFLGLQVALQTNAELLQLPDKYEASDSAAILAQVSADLISPAESTRLEALHWVSLTLLTSLLPHTLLPYFLAEP